MDQLKTEQGKGATGAARRRAGFSMIEVMISLSILAAGMLAMAGAQIAATRSGTSGRHTSDAAAIAYSQLDDFQRMSFSDPALAPTGGWTPAQIVNDTVQAPNNQIEQSYTLQWRIANVDTNLKAIDVQVTWSEPQRPNRSVTISSYRHNDSLTSY